MDRVKDKIASVHGFIKAKASQEHPLQTQVSLILTDFHSNKNKQGVPRSEAENILKSALNMPLKINFNGRSYAGHDNAIPIGPIVNVYETNDNGRDVIAADAVIWNEVFSNVSEYLKDVFIEGIGTSWEIYYSDVDKDEDGVEWLKNCVFAGTCIVDTPAYGPNRTRILAIAEEINKRELSENLMEENTETPEEIAISSDVTPTQLEETRTDILSAQDLLFQMYEGLEGLYSKTFEVERQNAEKNIESVAQTFSDLLSKISDKLSDMSAKAEELTSVRAELDGIKAAQAALELENAKAEKIKSRVARLSEAGVTLTQEEITKREVFLLEMSDSTFETYLSDIAIASKTQNKATSEKNNRAPIYPEPTGTQVTYSDLIAALNQHFKN